MVFDLRDEDSEDVRCVLYAGLGWLESCDVRFRFKKERLM
jgi:hypothetical protein